MFKKLLTYSIVALYSIIGAKAFATKDSMKSFDPKALAVKMEVVSDYYEIDSAKSFSNHVYSIGDHAYIASRGFQFNVATDKGNCVLKAKAPVKILGLFKERRYGGDKLALIETQHWTEGLSGSSCYKGERAFIDVDFLSPIGAKGLSRDFVKLDPKIFPRIEVIRADESDYYEIDSAKTFSNHVYSIGDHVYIASKGFQFNVATDKGNCVLKAKAPVKILNLFQDYRKDYRQLALIETQHWTEGLSGNSCYKGERAFIDIDFLSPIGAEGPARDFVKLDSKTFAETEVIRE